jgi:hypothetical protein
VGEAHDVTPASPQMADTIEMTSPPVPAGFSGLYEQYSEVVFRTALRVTGRPADAEDVLQTVFLACCPETNTTRPAGGRRPTSGARPSTLRSTSCAGGRSAPRRFTTTRRRMPPSIPARC